MDHPLKVREEQQAVRFISSKCSQKYPSPPDAWRICTHLGFELQINDYPFFSITHCVHTEDGHHREVLSRPEK